jgi:hypothetical protein
MKKLSILFLVVYCSFSKAEIILPPSFSGLEEEAKSTMQCIQLFDFEMNEFGPALEAKIRAVEYLSTVLQQTQPPELGVDLTEADIKRSLNPINFDRLAEAISIGATWQKPEWFTKNNRSYSLTFGCSKYLVDNLEEWKEYISTLE